MLQCDAGRAQAHRKVNDIRTERATLEDLAAGQCCTLGTIAVNANDIITFAEQYDPQPFHLDAKAAMETAAGGLIASGWHTASLMMRLLAIGRPFGISPILGIGVDELRWPTSVRPGDTLIGTATVLDVRPSTTKPDRGTVRLHVELRNERDDVVLTMKPMMVVPRRVTRGDEA